MVSDHLSDYLSDHMSDHRPTFCKSVLAVLPPRSVLLGPGPQAAGDGHQSRLRQGGSSSGTSSSGGAGRSARVAPAPPTHSASVEKTGPCWWTRHTSTARATLRLSDAATWQVPDDQPAIVGESYLSGQPTVDSMRLFPDVRIGHPGCAATARLRCTLLAPRRKGLVIFRDSATARGENAI